MEPRRLSPTTPASWPQQFEDWVKVYFTDQHFATCDEGGYCRLVEGEVATAGCGCAEDVAAARSDEWGDDDEHEASEDGAAGEVPGFTG